MKSLHLKSCLLALPALAITTATYAKKEQRPNIVIILSDDQGNADCGFQRSPATISTPAIDNIAKSGVVFTNGYASGYVSSPTRAGILTGRYQQRFGFYTANDSRQGLPLSEITLADLLQKEGYRTGVFGKWHLGIEPAYHPLKRGFQDFYGFMGHGGHDYYIFTCIEDKNYECIQRNFTPVNDEGYLTDILGNEACNFIDKNVKAKSPFFLYLPFNAVHAPLQAPEEDIKRFNTGNHNRDVQLAMIYRMDIAIGKVIQKLKDEGVYENTILFFLTDNGGAKATSASNLPLRDFKHSVYEGGLRIPFLMSWPAKYKHSVCNEAVMSFDILPTICAALEIKLPTDKIYDGKSILPAIKGKLKEPLHKNLFWDGNDNIWAVREGNWKLIFNKAEKLELYNLGNDLSETKDLSALHPEKVADMKIKFDTWRAEMKTPMGDSKKGGKKANKNNLNKKSEEE